MSVGVAVFQFWDDPIWIGVVAAIFAIGQFLEGNILSPKLVGGSVGLHPVWLMFSLSAFGAMLGFLGLLIAVPVSKMKAWVKAHLGRTLASKRNQAYAEFRQSHVGC